MGEASEQQAVVEWCAWKRIPVFHIPNGGWRHKHTAYQLKRQGVKPGVPDLFVPIAAGGKHGLFVEMKAEGGGRTSQAQREWIRTLREQGYRAEVCHGAGAAIAVIEGYLAG